MAAPSLTTQALSFIVNVGASYLLGRLTAQDGARLKDLDQASGDYGVAMPRLYGETVRVTGVYIAQDEIKETKHTVQDHSELIGALTGAAQGFLIGGPVGALIGGIAGGLLGAAAPNQHYYTYSVTMGLLLADRTNDDPIEGISKLWANGKVIFDGTETVAAEVLDGGKLVSRKYAKNRFFKSLTVYGGGDVQTADPILNATVGTQPGYRHSAYIVLEDLQLAEWGNSVPPVEALVAVKAGQTLADVAEAICAAAGIDHEHNLSTTALTGYEIRGYAITSETNCWDGLKPLLPVHRVDAAEVAGQIRFYSREQGLRATIPLDDMAGHIYGDQRPERIRYSRAMDTDLPLETSITFIDPARDYQPNTAHSKRSEGDAKSNINLTFALTLTAEEGATAAATIHWDAWLGRTTSVFSLTDQWISIAPGVCYGIPVIDQVLPYRVTRKSRGANGIIEVEAVSDESVVYTGTVSASSGNIPDEQSTAFADTRVVLMDMPILEDGHDDYGFYAVMAGTEAYWNRGRIEASGNGTDFATLLDDDGSAVMGDVTGTLDAGTTSGLDDTLDTTTVLTVVLEHSGMTLESTTDALLDAWDNFAFVGKDGLGEYLQFKTATQTGPTTWELTDLRRGRKGTDHALATHAAGEEFVLLGGAGVYRIPYPNTDKWGDELNFRGVTLHQDAADATIVDFTNTGEGKRPYSPVNVEGSWDGSNNLTVTWDSRSRMNSGELGIDDNEEWEVEITIGAGRVELTATESWVYTAADQTTDGLTAGGVVAGRVRQTSDVNDGRWRDFVLVGPGADVILLEDDTTSYLSEDGLNPFEVES